MNILVFMHSGTNSRDIYQDIVGGCRDAGHRIIVIDITPFYSMYRHQESLRPQLQSDICWMIREIIKDNHIDFCMCMWATGIDVLGMSNVAGQIVPFFEAAQCPLLQIWLDAPERAHQGSIIGAFRTPIVSSKYLYHFINNEGSAEEMVSLYGFKNVIPIPYGINAKTFELGPGQAKKYDIMVAGDKYDPCVKEPSPTMLEEFKKETPDVERIRQEEAQKIRPYLDEYAKRIPEERRTAAREVMEQLLVLQLADKDVPMVHRLQSIASRDPVLQRGVTALVENLAVYVDTALMVRRVENFYRAFVFAYLSKYFHCGHWGGADFSAWGIKEPSLGTLPYREMGKYYGMAKLGLSVMRYQDDVGVHIKPLEIAASGTACLAMYRKGIEQVLMPGKEVVCFKTPDEAKKQVEFLLANPDHLSQIAAAGYTRTIREHTWGKRMTLIPQIIEKLYQQNTAPANS